MASRDPSAPPFEPDSAGLPDRLVELRLVTGPSRTARYAALTSDFNPIHVDPHFAASTPFGAPINHGTLGLSLLARAIEATFGDAAYALDVRFTRPAPVGCTLVAGGQARRAEADETSEDGYDVHVTTSEGVRVIEGTLQLAGEAGPSRNTDS